MKQGTGRWAMLLWGYQLIFILSLPIWAIRLLLKSRRHAEHRHHLLERLGQVPIPPEGQRILWLHAVSLGESVSITPWIQRWLLENPSDTLYLTVTTPTGRAHFKKYFGENPRVYLSYLPWDQYNLMQRFFKRVRPEQLILVESEIWPMMLWLCQKKQCPVMMVNARLSQKSAQRYQQLSQSIRPLFEGISYVGTQTDRSVPLFESLCPASTVIESIGNLKFDRPLLSTPPNRKPVPQIWMIASSHEGEEQQALDCYQQLQQQYPEMILILAPRHPERFDRVERYCQAAKLSYHTHQQQGTTLSPGTVHVVNAMGVLSAYYQQAQVVVVGGTFVPIGGHNPLEPAAYAAALIVGPYTANCREAVRVLQSACALVVCNDDSDWLSTLSHWFDQPEQCAQAGQKGWTVMTQHQGASERFLSRVQSRWLSTNH